MPGCKHWLLILGLQGGRDKKQFDVLDSQGVHIEIAGSFDKKDLAIVKKQEEERKKRVLVASTADEVEVRVKAKY
jgi:hypothetical protein